jgi:DNA-binding protein H-NS
MINIYLQINRIWLYIYALKTKNEKGEIMAEEPQSVCEWLDIELDKLSADDKINLISEVCDELTAQQLRQVRELADQKRLGKIDEAKEQVITRMREEFEQLDLDFDEVMGLNRGRRRRSALPPKYRHPEGMEWSGRGFPPQWIRDFEESGGDRDDFRIPEGG